MSSAGICATSRAILTRGRCALTATSTVCLCGSPRTEQVALFNRHPELVGSEAMSGTMTASSSSEQGRLGLRRLRDDVEAEIDETLGQICALIAGRRARLVCRDGGSDDDCTPASTTTTNRDQ